LELPVGSAERIEITRKPKSFALRLSRGKKGLLFPKPHGMIKNLKMILKLKGTHL
jgi:hypothetical protein